MNPLEKLFKKRFLDKSQRDSPTITPPVVPAITIEAPVSTCPNKCDASEYLQWHVL